MISKNKGSFENIFIVTEQETSGQWVSVVSEQLNFLVITTIIIELKAVESSDYRFGWIQVRASSLSNYMTTASVFPTRSWR